MPTRAPLLRTALAALTLALATSAFAQQPGGAQPPAERPKAPTVSFEFPGGSLTDYVGTITMSAGTTPVNVILSDEASGLVVPAVTLKQVTLAQAFELLETSIDLGADARVYVREDSGDSGAAPVFSISVQRAGPRGSGPESQIQVFSLRDIVSPPPGAPATAADVSQVLTAVDTALELSGKEDADIRYHEDSNLLIVRAQPQQLSTIHLIIQTFSVAMDQTRNQTAQAQERIRSLEHQLARTELEMDLHARRYEQARAMLDHLRAQAEQGVVTQAELSNQEMRVAEAQTQIQLAQAEVNFLTSQLEDIKSSKTMVVHAEVSDGFYPLAPIPGLGEEFMACVADMASAAGASVRFELRDDDRMLVRTSRPVHKAAARILAALARAHAHDPDLPAPKVEYGDN